MPDCNDVLRLLPVLKGIPVACLLALLLAGPLDLAGLAQAAGYTQGRVLGALGMLETLGLVVLGTNGWMAVVENFEICATDSRVFKTQSLESLNLESESLDSETQTLDSDSESVLKILIFAQELFGEPVLLPPGLEVEPQILLGLLAEAYTNRNRLRKPARVVAANLKEGRQPSRRFLLDPRAYLPAEFVRKLYQAFPLSQVDFEADPPGLDDIHPPEALLQSETRPDKVQEPGRVPAGQSQAQMLWQEARQELQLTMPKPLYENYIHPLAALDFDSDEGTLFLQAGSAQACAWLDERLKRTLERLLIGIHGEALQVVFLPPEQGAADTGGGA